MYGALKTQEELPTKHQKVAEQATLVRVQKARHNRWPKNF